MPQRNLSSSSNETSSKLVSRGMRSSGESTARRDELIEQYTDFVGVVVSKLIRSMGLPVMLKDEFISAAFLGLVEAAGRFDPKRGRKFSSYAYLRIRGSVIDYIRSSCSLSGHAYRKFRALEAAQQLREQELDDRGAKGAISEKSRSRVALRQLEKSAISFKLTAVSHHESESGGQYETTPEDVVAQKQEYQNIRAIVATLPEKERTIIEQYYFNDRKLVDVAEQFSGLSKSWVSRLHDRALDMLREKLSPVVAEVAV